MVRKELSDFERSTVIGCPLCHKSVREMSALLDVPRSTVSAIIVKWKRRGATTARPQSGRPRKLICFCICHKNFTVYGPVLWRTCDNKTLRLWLVCVRVCKQPSSTSPRTALHTVTIHTVQSPGPCGGNADSSTAPRRRVWTAVHVTTSSYFWSLPRCLSISTFYSETMFFLPSFSATTWTLLLLVVTLLLL